MKVWFQIVGTAALLLLGGLILWCVVFKVSGSAKETIVARASLEASRTHDHQLSSRSPYWEESLAAEVFGSIRPTSSAGLRYVGFVLLPDSGGYSAVSLSLSPDDDQARGRLISADAIRAGQEQTHSRQLPPVPFTMSKADFLSVQAQVYELTENWKGSKTAFLCADGNGMAFEMQIPPGLISSGSGESCDPHYLAVERAFQPIIRAARSPRRE